MIAYESIDFRRLRSQVRILLILHAAERANVEPLGASALHAFAYLSNVLSPIWNLVPLEGAIYKHGPSPYYPLLQRDVDDLVAHGLIEVATLDYVQTHGGAWRFAGSFRLNHSLSDNVLSEILGQSELDGTVVFFQEMAFALSALEPQAYARLATWDANYLDPRVSEENVVDFAEWNKRNFSAGAARSFETLIPGLLPASEGEQLNLYLRHLKRLMSGKRSS